MLDALLRPRALGGGKARFSEGRRIAEELLTLAQRLGDRVLLLEARHALSPTTLWAGEPVAARQHSEQGMALYDQEQHRSLAFHYGGHDPGVCCHMHSALALWMLGYPAAALERGRIGLTLARTLAHPPSLTNALPFLMVIHQLRGEVDAVQELAGSMIDLSAAHGLAQWLRFGRILDAWTQTERGDGDASLAQLRNTVQDYRSKGTDLWFPCFLAILTAALLKKGAIDEGLTTVTDALENADMTGAHIWAAEFHRLQGELLLARDPGAASQAEGAFQRALVIADSQKAKSWELRAAVSLSRLWRSHGKRAEAGRLLGGIHGWFSEGFDTQDLRDAKIFLLS